MSQATYIDPAGLKSQLRAGGWIFSSVAPQLRHSLIEALAPLVGQEVILRDIPTCLLTYAYYRGETSRLTSELGGKKISSGHEVIDAHVRCEKKFWENALLEVVNSDAQLASMSEEDSERLERAVETIVSLVPDLEGGLHFVRQIVFYESSIWTASSQPHYSGCIFLHKRLLSSPLLEETMVHELAHQELFCLNLLDRLVEASADEKSIYAPFQKRERPTLARLHAAHSLYRVCQFLRLCGSSSFDENATCLLDTLDTFSQGDLTEFGKFLIRECYERICRENHDNENKLRSVS